MADNPLEQGRNGGRATQEADPKAASGAAPAAASGGIKSWLPLIITIVSMPALAYATTKFVLVPQMKKSLAAATGATETPAPGAPAETKDGAPAEPAKGKVKIPMSKILVNVAGTMGTRYLMSSMTLVGNSDQLRAKVEENKDQLMDLATSTLSTKTISDLEKPGARNVIRAELITVFNNALGGPWVTEIYITEMAIQ
ncbi:MAG TPA: flagellar basal body-associated FliL family protein [Verrucomicrobiae bacterium]|jgi:flagellar FliL protein|nr:flagellar basal body-associated FliL family protein [Verrucomicrobiae bacterium]